MLTGLDKRLLVLVLTLQFLLASHMTDITDDQELAIHVTKLSWLDTNLE